MTTNTTNSQAASIDTPEFWVLLNAREEGAMDEAHAEELEQDIVKFIDAKLAQEKCAAEEWRHLAMMAARASRENLERAEKAESRLTEIQRGVEDAMTKIKAALQYRSDADAHIAYVAIANLLQPQGQADTSGLPG